jgi:oxygen-dependent protoporphyrinogen oxidase
MAGERVTVIGGGFGGLVSAWALARAGYSVDLHEASDHLGGMIGTEETAFGKVERAANGLIANDDSLALFADLGLEPVRAGKDGKRRYIFRDGRPRRWPLTVPETLALSARLPSVRKKAPREGESLESWAKRTLGPAAFRYGVAPAIQGIYAGDPSTMSAGLILGRFFRPRDGAKKRSKAKGTIAAPGGMTTLVHALDKRVRELGVRIHLGSPLALSATGPVVLATSLPAARKLLEPSFPAASATLAQARMLPLACVHLAFPRDSGELHGFGCLFPRGEGVRSLGVLFEQSIFGDRSSHHLERWIVGGACDPGALELSDDEMIASVLEDRRKIVDTAVAPIGSAIVRWPSALPHYDSALEQALASPAVRELPEKGVFLIGNYTGKLGLSGILENALALPERMRAAGESAA